MVGDSSCVVVFYLFLKLEYATSQLEILGQHAGAIILQLSNLEGAYVV
jgi:hypothetical protein